MITEQALREAIAEVQGKRNPNRDDCMMLAAFYTIQEHLFPSDGQESADTVDYSHSSEMPDATAENTIHIESGTEFAQAINGMKQEDGWALMDELMETIRILQPRLYGGVLRKIKD